MNTAQIKPDRSRHRMPMGLFAAAALLTLLAASCGSDSEESRGLAVVTFQVEGETFRAELVTQDQVDNARKLLRGEEAPSIPNGVVERGDPGVNSPWTWHLDPATIEFADVTTEVCDGLPSDVENDIITSDRYCPWSAEVIDVQTD